MSLIMPNGSRTIPYGGDWMKGQPRPQQPQQGYPQRPTNQRPGQAQPQQDPYGTATPYGGKPQSMGPQWNQGGTNQQQTRQQPFQQYMTQGSPYGGRSPYTPSQPAPPQQYGGYTPSDSGVDFSMGEDGQIRDRRYRQPAAGSPGPSQPGRYMPPPGGQPPIGPGLIDPNVANNPYANRPQPFQQTTQNFDGTQSQMPNFQQRDAFIGQINNQLGQMQNQSWQQPGMGAPQFDFPQMWGQAGEMVKQGWQNPFAAQGGSESQIRNLLQGDIRPEALGQPGLMSGLPPGATLDSQPAIPRSVTYAQPGGGVGHKPPPFISHDSDGDGVDDRVQPGPGQPPRVFPGTAQPIPPQSPGTPPGQTRPVASDQYQEQIDRLTSEMRGDGADRGSLQRQIDYYKQLQQKERSRGGTRASPSPRPSGNGSSDMDFLAADPNLTPRQKSEKFLAANNQAIKDGTFRHSDIDSLGLSGPDARLAKNKATLQMQSWETLRKADETAKMFPQLDRGLNQLYAAYGRKYG